MKFNIQILCLSISLSYGLLNEAAFSNFVFFFTKHHDMQPAGNHIYIFDQVSQSF